MEKDFKHLTNWITTVVDPELAAGHDVIIVGPIKCGKKIMMEYLSLRINNGTHNDAAHIYASALHRKDEQDQIDELEQDYDFIIKFARQYNELLSDAKQLATVHSKVFIHLNESDYGTGDDSCLSKVFDKIEAIPNVQFICISATNDEAIHSYFGNLPNTRILYYTPPSNYCGVEWFLNNNLVYEAEPAWVPATKTSPGCITTQGHECLNILKNSNDKVFGFFRIPYGMKKVKDQGEFEKAIKKQYGFDVLFVGAEDSFIYNDGPDNNWELRALKKRKTVIVICQTATRSTEITFHNYIAFWHGAERKKTPANTIYQADGRVIHYYGKRYAKPCHIPVYTATEVFRYYAGRLPQGQLSRPVSSRVTNKVAGAPRGRPSKYIKTQVVYNHYPTIQEYNQEAAKIGADLKTRIDPRSVKGNKVDDAAGYILRNSNGIFGGAKVSRGYAQVFSFDGPAPEYISSWNNAKHLHGKFVLILDVPRKQTTATVTPLRAVKTMYNV